MDSSIGWGHFWSQGDAVTRGVALMLLAMSIITWSVLCLKAMQLARLRKQAGLMHDWPGMSEAQRQAVPDRSTPDDPYAQLTVLARQAGAELEQAAQTRWVEMRVDPSDWVTRRLQSGLDAQWREIQSRLTLLASVGATAPFVGLFGTVWGIYHALIQMGQSGQASIDQVAGPVGEALIMTAFGLAVAIPAVLAYNGLVRLGKNRQAHLREFATALHAEVVRAAARAGVKQGA